MKLEQAIDELDDTLVMSIEDNEPYPMRGSLMVIGGNEIVKILDIAVKGNVIICRVIRGVRIGKRAKYGEKVEHLKQIENQIKG